MQRATITGIRIRSPSDARIVFHSVYLNILPMVTRRLDTEERSLITSGSVYVWEERGQHTELTGVGYIQRLPQGFLANHLSSRWALRDGQMVISNPVSVALSHFSIVNFRNSLGPISCERGRCLFLHGLTCDLLCVAVRVFSSITRNQPHSNCMLTARTDLSASFLFVLPDVISSFK